MNLLISLRSDILKTKRTAAFYFTLIGAAIIPVILMISIITHGLPEKERTAVDPINALFDISSEVTGMGILPLFVVLLCTLLPQIEFKNSAWKQVLTSPQTKTNVFIAKFLNINLMILLFFIINHLFLWGVVIVAHLVRPEYHILSYSFNLWGTLEKMGHAYISVLAIASIQFWIGLRSRNFLIPIAIGLACWMAGAIMVFQYNSAWSPYFPYCFPPIRYSRIFSSHHASVEWLSFGYTLLFLVAGYLDFQRRKMAK